MNKISKAIRPKRPQIKKPIVSVPVEKKIKEKFITEEVKVRLSGSQLILQTENKTVFLHLSDNQLEMLKVAFKEIV